MKGRLVSPSAYDPLMPGGLPDQYVDADPAETREWVESLDAVIDNAGPTRARFLVLEMLRRSHERRVGVPALRSTDYINTISPDREPAFPGDEQMEYQIRAMTRWNAAMLVHRAQRPGIGVGGHISSYASSAAMYEVGFNHFFRGPDAPDGGDQIFFQGHAAPGMYARAFLEGQLTESQLDGFRQELSHPGGGLPSYPHPRLLPEFWQFPTVSMGLGPLHAIYQARFNRYLLNRGIKDTSQQRVWAFLGDGETDEPEALGNISLAAREGLDNLTFVINCNLQRLDGPVRGNGNIIQELESIFRGAGWNVIKVIWGRGWDKLLARDVDGALVNLMNNTPDGNYQTYRGEDVKFLRENFFGRDPRVAAMVADIPDEELWALKRGGMDYRKLYSAYRTAVEHTGQPTVILAKTIKGWSLGQHFESRNATHQMKKLSEQDLRTFRDRLNIPIPDAQLDKYLPPYYNPGPDDPRIQYMMERRRALGGSMPRRSTASRPLAQPPDTSYDIVTRGSGKQEVATTMAFVRLFKDLTRDPDIGYRFVPIIPDEARTFGMDALFPTLKIYNPKGQNYLSVDRELMLSYKEATNGQILHEGIDEAGSVASFAAAGTSYSTHDQPMIPVYIFYSMFGFQRTADSFWLAGDQMARGFVMGATAGRTTLNGEGLQHEDGHSHLIAMTNPAVVAYDPAYAYEIGHIVRDGLRRMYGEDSESVFYYITVYNEPYVQPAQPQDLDVAGLLRGMYLLAPATADHPLRAQVLASGVAVPWALKAQAILAEEWGVAADVWSVTSWTELRRDGLAADKQNLFYPTGEPAQPYVTQRLTGRPGPVIGVSDYMHALQDMIRPWVPGDYATLGTDGFGMSDTRGALRRHFLVDAESIVCRTLLSLAERGEIDRAVVRSALDKYRLWDPTAADAGNTEGGG
jgi:pyruvate dehydrogenase E1 component